jgi:glycerol transport system ATP-binding protein
MQLTLERVSKTVAAETHLHAVELTLRHGVVNVLLGPTLAGKTSLLRVLAGLDRPTSGRLVCDGQDVTGLPVRKRDVAMVYQQFINYPSLTVFENIAAPLRNAGRPGPEIKRRVETMAEMLHLGRVLDRVPGELSGGQQQRTALARALVKGAGLLLLDEPLVNLDYKLREELRAELQTLFGSNHTTVVYATTEPREALQLGGYTAVLHQGQLLQYGPTLEVFARPESLEAARAFSDPPLNVLPATWRPPGGGVAGGCLVPTGAGDLLVTLPAEAREKLNGTAGSGLYLAIRPHQLRLERRQVGDQAITARVDLAEITGSETFVHVSRGDLSLVLQLPGVVALDLGKECTVYLDPNQLYGFGQEGRLLFAPAGEA